MTEGSLAAAAIQKADETGLAQPHCPLLEKED
jgi:hypothetical protein